jgi:hypothetical protein
LPELALLLSALYGTNQACSCTLAWCLLQCHLDDWL